jgi:hypothetical protein
VYIETKKDLLMTDFSDPTAGAVHPLPKGRYDIDQILNPSDDGICIVLTGTTKGFTGAEVDRREFVHLMQEMNW